MARRAAIRERIYDRGACPTPWKLIFRNKRSAKRHITKAHGRSARYVYLCACGRYHLTKRERKEAEQ